MELLKKMMPAAVFVLGISGAFLTTSMQSDAKVDAAVDGHLAIPGNPCALNIECSDTGGDVCRLFYPNGPQVFAFEDDNETTCPKVVYRP